MYISFTLNPAIINSMSDQPAVATAPAPLEVRPDRDYIPKQLRFAQFTEPQDWHELSEFILSVKDGFFHQQALPESITGPDFYTPSLSLPADSAKTRRFCALIDLEDRNPDAFLMIGDVYSLVFQIWQKVLYEEYDLTTKHRIALENRNTFLPETAEYRAWEARAAKINELVEKIQTDIKREKAYFDSTLGRFRFRDLAHRITKDLEHSLLEQREVDISPEMRERLENLVKVCDGIAHQKTLPIQALTKEEQAESISEEAPSGEAAATPTAEATQAATAPGQAAGDTTADAGGDTDTTAQQQPPEPPPEARPPRQIPDEEKELVIPVDPLTGRIDRKKRFEQVLELERQAAFASAQVFDQLETLYGIRFDDEPLVRGMAEDQVRSWLLEDFGPFGLGRLTQDTGLRQTTMLKLVGKLVNQDGDFAQAVNRRLDKHLEKLKTGPAAAREEFIKKVTEAQAPGALEKFNEDLQAKIWTRATFNPQEIAAAARLIRANPSLALEDALAQIARGTGQPITDDGQAPLFDAGRFQGIELTNMIGLADTLINLGYRPAFWDAIDPTTFAELTRVNLTYDEYRAVVQYLKLYSAATRQNYAFQNIKLNFPGFNLDQLERLAQTDAGKYIDEPWRRENIDKIRQMMESAEKLGGLKRGTKLFAVIIGTRSNEDLKEPDAEDSVILNESENVSVFELRTIYVQATWEELPPAWKEALTIYLGSEPNPAMAPAFSREDLQAVGDILSQQAGPGGEETGGRLYKPQMNFDPAGGIPFNFSPRNGNDLQRFAQRLLAGRKKTGVGGQVADAALTKGKEALLNAISGALGAPGLGTLYVNAVPKWLQKVIELGGLAGLVGEGIMLAVSAGARLGGLIGSIISPGIGTLLGIPIGFGLEQLLKGAGTKLGGFLSGSGAGVGGGATATSSTGAAAGNAVARSLPTKATIAAKATPAAKALAVGQHLVANPLTQGLFVTLGGTMIATTFTMMTINGAFLANFTLPDKDPITNEKISKYLSIEKQIVLPAGCEPISRKCPELADGTNYQVTYNIILTSKGNYTVYLTGIKDELVTKYSKKKYEELKLPLPETKTREKVLITSGFSINSSTTPEPSPPLPVPSGQAGNTPHSDFPELSTNPTDEKNTIAPGETLVLTYTETFDSHYNHSTDSNTFRADFRYIDGSNQGNDYVQTGKQFCIGDCSMVAGCWPATGSITQIPFEEDCGLDSEGKKWRCSHTLMDAFDIGMGVGNKVYAPFAGKVCIGHGDTGWGEPYLTMTSNEGSFLFGHLSETIIGSECKDVEAGELIALSGDTGHNPTTGQRTSTGPHLHFGMARGSAFAGFGPPSALAPLLPPDDQGTEAQDITEEMAKAHNHSVTTCYDDTKK